jgi:hypothetical protein
LTRYSCFCCCCCCCCCCCRCACCWPRDPRGDALIPHHPYNLPPQGMLLLPLLLQVRLLLRP